MAKRYAPFLFLSTTRKHSAWVAICVALASFSGLAQAQIAADDSVIVLVAHPDVPTSWLTRDTTRAMFAMRQRTWPDGQAVQVFVLPNRDPIHARFSKEQLAVYPHQLQLAWDRVVFSGRGQAPNRVRNLNEMHEKVASTPGALGYLEREYLDDNVQVISME